MDSYSILQGIFWTQVSHIASGFFTLLAKLVKNRECSLYLESLIYSLKKKKKNYMWGMMLQAVRDTGIIQTVILPSRSLYVEMWNMGSALMVQWLRLLASTTGGMGLIPCQEILKKKEIWERE